MNGLHNIIELLIYFFLAPAIAHAVLGHFKRGYRNTTGIYSFCGSDNQTFFLEIGNRFVAGRHVGELEVVLRTACGDEFCFFDANFVLGSTRNIYITLYGPWLFTFVEFTAELVRVHLDVGVSAGPDLKKVVQFLRRVDSIRIIDITVMSADRYNLAAKFSDLGRGTPGNIAISGENECLSLDGVIFVREYLLSIIDSAETGCFRTDQASAVGQTLSGKNSVVEAVADSAVLSEQISDFTAADTDVTGRYVCVRADMPLQFCHE